MREDSVTAITDDEVYDSFLDACYKDTGAYSRYLQQSTIGLLMGQTLFVHGAVNSANCGFVPDANTVCDKGYVVTGSQFGRVGEWTLALELFKTRAFLEWKDRPTYDEERVGRGGEQLMAYNHRSSVKGRTVVVSTWMGEGNDGFVLPGPSDGAYKYLVGNGVRRIVTGHIPVGDW